MPKQRVGVRKMVSIRAHTPIIQRRVGGLKPASSCLWTVPRAQALLRGRAWVAQLWAKSVRAVRLRALPPLFGAAGVSLFRCEPLRAGCCCGGERGVRCFVGVNLSSSLYHIYLMSRVEGGWSTQAHRTVSPSPPTIHSRSPPGAPSPTVSSQTAAHNKLGLVSWQGLDLEPPPPAVERSVGYGVRPPWPSPPSP